MLRDIKINTLNKKIIENHMQDFIRLTKQILPSQRQYWGRKHFLLDLPEKWHYSQGAFFQEGLIGFIIASQKSCEHVHIHKYVVDENFRNMKIGRKMLLELIKLSIKNGVKVVSLYIYKDNPKGIKYHQSNSFEIIAERNTELGELLEMEASVQDIYTLLIKKLGDAVC